MAGGDASGEPAKAGARKCGGAGGEGKASVRARWRAPLPEAEAAVRLRQGSLQGAGEEHGAAGAAVRAGQPADGGGSTGGVVRVVRGNGGLRAASSPQRPIQGQTQGAECRSASEGSQFSPPSAAPSNTTQTKTALFRGFLIIGRLRSNRRPEQMVFVQWCTPLALFQFTAWRNISEALVRVAPLSDPSI